MFQAPLQGGTGVVVGVGTMVGVGIGVRVGVGVGVRLGAAIVGRAVPPKMPSNPAPHSSRISSINACERAVRCDRIQPPPSEREYTYTRRGSPGAKTACGGD